MHHFDAAACQSEGERPDGTVACPGYELVDGCSGWEASISLMVHGLPLKFAAYTVYSATPIGLISGDTANVGGQSVDLDDFNECLR
jgi:hypothetical protein